MNKGLIVSDMASASPKRQPTDWSSPEMQARIRARYRSEKIFRALGLGALVLAASFLLFLLFDITSKGWTGFLRTEARVEVTFDPAVLMLDPAAIQGPGGKDMLMRADYQSLVSAAEQASLKANVLSEGAWLDARDHLAAHPQDLGKRIVLWLPTTSNYDLLAKGLIERSLPEDQRPVSNDEIKIFDNL